MQALKYYRYVGNVSRKAGVFAGIDLNSEHHANGKNDGSVAGIRYFKATGKLSGIFASVDKVSKVEDNSTSQTSRSYTSPITSTPSPHHSTPTKQSKMFSPPTHTPTNVTARRTQNQSNKTPKLYGNLSPKAMPSTPTTNRRASSSLRISSNASTESRSSVTPRPRAHQNNASSSFQSRDGPAEMLPPPRPHSAASSISSVTSLDPQSVQIEKLQRKVAGLTEELVRLQNERQGDEAVELARQRQHDKEIEKLAKDRHVELESCKKELQEKALAHDNLRSNLDDMVKEIDRLQNYVSEQQGSSEIEQLKAHIEELEGPDAQQEATERNHFIAELETELGLANTQIAEDEKQSKLVLEKIASLEKVVTDMDADLQREKEASGKLRSSLQKLQEAPSKGFDDEIQGMKVIIDQLTKENRELRNHLDTRENHSDKQNEVEQFQHQIADLERMVERRVFREHELESEIERLRAGDLVPSDKKAAFVSYSQNSKTTPAYCEICEVGMFVDLQCKFILTL